MFWNQNKILKYPLGIKKFGIRLSFSRQERNIFPMKYRNKKIKQEISTDFRIKKNEIKQIYCFNFISIEFEYQNSGYSHDSTG